ELERGLRELVPVNRQVIHIERVESRTVRTPVVLGAYNWGSALAAICTIYVGGEQPISDLGKNAGYRRVEEEVHHTRVGISGDHFFLFERVNANAIFIPASEIARGEEIRVAPNS